MFGGLFELDEDLIRDLEKAALLHDVYKRSEVRGTRGDKGWEAYEVSAASAGIYLRNCGVSKRVVDLTGAVGHLLLEIMADLLKKEQ